MCGSKKRRTILSLALFWALGLLILGTGFEETVMKGPLREVLKKEETKNPTDSKETSTGTAGKKPTGTSASGKQVKTAKTGDSISYLWILMIAGSIAVIGGMIYVIRRRKQK